MTEHPEGIADPEHKEWLQSQFSLITDTVHKLSPTEVAEKHRYLPEGVTRFSGPFRISVCPYWKEPLDCFDVRSPVREVTIMKPAQVCFTVTILEGIILYNLVQIKTQPVLAVTADAEMARARMEKNITPMLQDSDLMHLIQSIDRTNSRKTGKRDDSLEWIGGGSLSVLGALNANKFRSHSFPVIVMDEEDSYPDNVGGQGDTGKLIEARAKGYWEKRKILRGSTPLIKGSSNIEKSFEKGDKRYYTVPCKKCGEKQRLIFEGTHEDGEKYGLTWEYEDDGRLKAGSVRYVCKHCGHKHKNSDKTWMFKESNGAEWVPTAVPKTPNTRSYHINGLYSPVGMFSWEDGVRDYLDAYDPATGRVKDFTLFQEFYNNFLGKTFEVSGDKVLFVQVSAHRRIEYKYGQIPNHHAATYTQNPISVLTCAVDVHKNNLKVGVFGWTRGNRSYLIDYFTFEGETDNIDSPGTWGKLQELIDTKVYEDNERRYRIALTFVDAGYNNEVVVTFCSQWQSGVIPIVGADSPAKRQKITEWGEFTTTMGTRGVRIMVDYYKDRYSARLRTRWDGVAIQPEGHFNAPVDATDDQLKELTRETKKEKIEKATGKHVGYVWHRPGNAPNELWDLIVYNSCALDVLCYDLCFNLWQLETVNWVAFYDYIEAECLYYEKIPATSNAGEG